MFLINEIIVAVANFFYNIALVGDFVAWLVNIFKCLAK